ncbi:MAG: hypothetical protein DIZ80_10770 [endosymbiont of Galathealinum brachiosum]|uniref:Uncharacterized protein n=1 Tax=endosymbiont of Galathealinum brachiosum TaxID=2200906 RepID=A0A370DCV7_9GAMM|nr:MAG: hypothetical protein DIZ80_10770 [endosymbiont of Galathealinum brachiosum]
MKPILISVFSLLILLHSQLSNATDSAMDNNRLGELISRIDAKPDGQKGYWKIKYKNIPVYIITSEKANRLRIISPIKSSESLSKDQLYRMMQANFDSALDARYSIAKGKLWSAFIHPLSELTDEQFFSGLAQTITLVNSYGDSYSSGALVFSGGDSQDLNSKTFMDILKKGLKI